MDNFLTINEIASRLRVSRHTVQAWISPSSPNHRPEFALLARHAGRKTVFIESEVEVWINQRRGAIYSENMSGRTAYWREKFIAGRGLLKDALRAPESAKASNASPAFAGGLLALDAEPVIAWLADAPACPVILRVVDQADGLILSVPLVIWLLRRMMRIQGRFSAIKDFFISSNIFDLAPLTENSIQRSIDLPGGIPELSLNGYCCSMEAGASAFYTGNAVLAKSAGLSVIQY